MHRQAVFCNAAAGVCGLPPHRGPALIRELPAAPGVLAVQTRSRRDPGALLHAPHTALLCPVTGHQSEWQQLVSDLDVPLSPDVLQSSFESMDSTGGREFDILRFHFFDFA